MRLSKIKISFCILAASVVVLPGAMANASSMLTGKLTSQPIGHYEFCLAYKEECKQERDASLSPVNLTRDLWKKIVNINSAINMVIEPRSDLEIYGREEVWAYPDIAGDCEDYVLLKRQMLMKEGISPSALLITVVRKPDGEGHAVLTVRTDRGDFVLDNLNSQVRVWDQTPYEYLKRQSERHAGHWVTIENTDMTVVGSVKKSD